MEATARAWALAQPLVAAFISAAVRDHADAQDVLQEVAVAVFGDAPRPAPGAFNGWVLGIARHKVADLYRGKRRDPEPMDGALLDSLVEVYAQHPDIWTSQGQALDHCIRRVKGDARRLLALRYQEGLTPDEIARSMNRAPGAVRVSLHRVRAALRDCIERRLSGGKPPAGGA